MKKSPVILHFVTWYPSEANHAEGIFIQRQVESLASGNEYQHVVVRKKKSTTGIWEHIRALFGLYSSQQIGKATVISLPEESKLYRLYFWRHQKKIERFLLNNLYKKLKPSLAHLHVVYGFAEEAIYLKKEKGLPFIISEHMGPFPFEWISNKEKFIREPITQADAVVAVSTAQAKQIQDFTGVHSLIIPNVVREQEFYFDPAIQQNKKNRQLQIAFTGIYTKAKGADYLLSALPSFLEYAPGTLLHLVGAADEKRMAELNDLVKQNGLADNVVFHGNLLPAAINQLYNQCDFYVCSSEWESFGLSVLEGLFAGLPALSTSCGGVIDFIDDNNGLLVANDQRPETLLEGLLAMRNKWAAFDRKKIAEDVRVKFSADNIREQYLNIYRRLVEAGSSAA